MNRKSQNNLFPQDWNVFLEKYIAFFLAPIKGVFQPFVRRMMEETLKEWNLKRQRNKLLRLKAYNWKIFGDI